MKKLAVFVISLLSATFAFAQPKNIILVMVDGMGVNHSQIITSEKNCVLNNFDVNYAVSNYPTYWNTLDKEYDVNYYRGDYHVRRVWQEFDYADSLPIDPITAGSALATGVKPAFDAVSYDMDNTELETILERAMAKGKMTAIATNGSVWDNSAILPFVCHKKVAQTTEDFDDLFFDVLKSKVNLVISSELYSVENENWVFVADQKNMPANLSKQVMIGKETLQSKEFGELTAASLDLLATNENGFVFVSECANIEMDSDNENVRVQETMADVDAYISTIYSWVEQNSNWDETLLIVVGSYEKGYATSKSFDKSSMHKTFLSKSKEDFQYNSLNNTNLLTPMYAKGNGSELFLNYADETDFVLGSYINNTEIAQVCFRLMPNEIKKPKNIIFMVNDGCGISPIKAAEYYTGKATPFTNFPVALWNCTHASATSSATSSLANWNNTYESRLAWTGKDYLWKGKNATCSGASATAMSSGKKTYYFSLGVDVERNAMKSIARHAKEMGKSAGVATNSPYYDATPGAFFTNNPSRLNYNDLSRQLVIESNADVVIGCDHPEYDNNGQKKESPDYTNVGGEEIMQGLRAGATTYAISSNSGWNTVRDIDGDGEPDPWTFVEDSASLVQYMTGETPKRLFGMIPVEGSMQFYRDGIDVNNVHYDDWNKGMPRLWQIGRVAINCLSKNENGFFLMIENDMVDNGGHKNRPGRQLEEQIEFNRTVDSVIAWIEKESSWDETLLIITADHETGFMADPTFKEDSIMLNHWQIIDNGVGNMPGIGYYSIDHTNQLVPFFAKGVGSEIFYSYADEWDYVRGKYLNNSEIGQSMFELWEGTACSYTNESPKINFTDTLFVKQSTDFRFELPKDIVTDKEDELSIKLVSKPTWVNFDEENFALYGTSLKRTGTSLVSFTATDGAKSGAAIEISFTVKICIYADKTNMENITSNKAVYPTLAMSKVTVRTDGNDGQIIMRNMLGQTVKTVSITNNLTEIGVSDLPKGEYLIQIIEDKNVTTKKIIVR
ncbi:MAG: alkaline phosphatase [Bacteroidales bacterium]|nr:alkaline phosphatase [Bacteroidales bacterium]